MKKVLFWAFILVGIAVFLVSLVLVLSIYYSNGFFAALIVLLTWVLALASFIIGSLLLKKYYQTKKLIFLLVGLLLTFVIPGVYLLFLFSISARFTATCYAPFVVGSLFLTKTPKFNSYRKNAIKKLKDKLPDDLLSQISKQER